ncbi:DUF4149 domain-containing protein [Geobacter sp. SVR]|uniref:DUF4149 domain-containing protein n=1 Tax=Geobacter sp. SVR TaxID=2495594 RepID=UPI00143EFFDC|nr:membrane protein [Geobacter sp. SVR]
MHVAGVVYRLAVSLWFGGVTLFTLVLTPVLFKTQSRDLAGTIVGLLFPAYFRWGLACGVLALACHLLVRGREWLPVVVIAAMLALTAVQAFYIEPRAAALKRQIPSFDTTPKEHPLRREFSRLHGISASCNLAMLGGGALLVVLM